MSHRVELGEGDFLWLSKNSLASPSPLSYFLAGVYSDVKYERRVPSPDVIVLSDNEPSSPRMNGLTKIALKETSAEVLMVSLVWWWQAWWWYKQGQMNCFFVHDVFRVLGILIMWPGFMFNSLAFLGDRTPKMHSLLSVLFIRTTGVCSSCVQILWLSFLVIVLLILSKICYLDHVMHFQQSRCASHLPLCPVLF